MNMSSGIVSYGDMPKILYLTKDDVKSAGLTDEDFINCVSDSLWQQNLGKVDLVPKMSITLRPDARLNATAGWVEKLGAVGFNWSSYYPNNCNKGMNQYSGMIVLSDISNGLPYVIMDCFYIISKRTAAVTAVSAKYLARKDSQTVGIIGAGVQGRENLRMLQLVLPHLNLAKIYDISPNAVNTYIRTMSDEFRGKIVPCQSIEETVKDVDILITATAITENPAIQIKDKWLPKKGIFIAPLDLLSLIDRDTILRMDKISTDDCIQLKTMERDFSFNDGRFTQLDELCVGKKIGRENEEENTLAINFGLALHDIYIAKKIYDVAKELEIGTWLHPLTW
jgi:ornithine cyclodeaminase/alanine dehydrogenase-like protein (mu-crystallin family)